MRFAKFNYLDWIILAIFAFLLYDLFSHWSEYAPCPNPINIWLFVTYVLIAFTRIIYTVMKTTEILQVFKACVVIIICGILPALISWSALGSIWFSVNNQLAPACVPSKQLPFLTIWWLGLCSFVSLIMLITLGIELNKFRRQRRVLTRYQRILQSDDTFYNYFTVQGLLNNDSQGPQGLVEHGLIRQEIDYLQQFSFDYLEKNEIRGDNGLSGGAGDKEACSICLCNYVNRDRLCMVPSCRHIFHQACLNQWLVKCPSCPYCKKNIRSVLLDTVEP